MRSNERHSIYHDFKFRFVQEVDGLAGNKDGCDDKKRSEDNAGPVTWNS